MIRYAKTDDAAEICKIYNHYVLGTTITFEEEPVSTDEMAQRIAETLQSLPSRLGTGRKPSGLLFMRANGKDDALTAIRLNRRLRARRLNWKTHRFSAVSCAAERTASAKIPYCHWGHSVTERR